MADFWDFITGRSAQQNIADTLQGVANQIIANYQQQGAIEYSIYAKDNVEVIINFPVTQGIFKDLFKGATVQPGPGKSIRGVDSDLSTVTNILKAYQGAIQDFQQNQANQKPDIVGTIVSTAITVGGTIVGGPLGTAGASVVNNLIQAKGSSPISTLVADYLNTNYQKFVARYNELQGQQQQQQQQQAQLVKQQTTTKNNTLATIGLIGVGLLIYNRRREK